MNISAKMSHTSRLQLICLGDILLISLHLTTEALIFQLGILLKGFI